MTKIAQVSQFLNQFAPTRLAEEWDNVGLLVGDPKLVAERIMTCLTVTPESAAEAISQQANLIVSHHPIPFRPLKRITTETVARRQSNPFWTTQTIWARGGSESSHPQSR